MGMYGEHDANGWAGPGRPPGDPAAPGRASVATTTPTPADWAAHWEQLAADRDAAFDRAATLCSHGWDQIHDCPGLSRPTRLEWRERLSLVTADPADPGAADKVRSLLTAVEEYQEQGETLTDPGERRMVRISAGNPDQRAERARNLTPLTETLRSLVETLDRYQDLSAQL